MLLIYYNLNSFLDFKISKDCTDDYNKNILLCAFFAD